MYPDFVSIDIRETLQKLDTLHLVLHFYLAQLPESGLLKGFTSILASTIVKNEKKIAILCHVGLPTTAAIVPAGIHVVSMWSPIHVDDCRIFLLRIEIDWLHHAVV